jgi:hypothetical protein
MTATAPVLGVLAGVAGIAGTVPYVRHVLRRSTRPHLSTWLVWSLLAVVVCLSQRADGASWTLAMAATHAVLTSLVAVLALRAGAGGIGRADRALIAVALGGVAGWLLVDEPLVATAGVVVADVIAAAMMIPKTWRDPGSETLSTFVLASGGGALAAGAVERFDPSLLLYPLYSCAVNGVLAAVIVHRRAVARRWPDGRARASARPAWSTSSDPLG